MTYIITQISGKQYLMELNKFYDVDFIKENGLSSEDLDAIGVEKVGHRKMLQNLYRLKGGGKKEKKAKESSSDEQSDEDSDEDSEEDSDDNDSDDHNDDG